MSRSYPPDAGSRGEAPRRRGPPSLASKLVAFAGGLLAGLFPWALVVPSTGYTSARDVLAPPVIGSVIGIAAGLACLYPRRTRWFSLGLLVMLVVVKPSILSSILKG